MKGCRKVGKKDMKWNEAMPKMKVDPERYVSRNRSESFAYAMRYKANVLLQTVEADGQILTAEPATTLPLSQAYFIY